MKKFLIFCIVAFISLGIPLNKVKGEIKQDNINCYEHVVSFNKYIKEKQEKKKPVVKKKKSKWRYIGDCRVTSYCPYCNDGSGHESSSGRYLSYGHVACNWLPIGTKISIEGDIFVVADICGTEAIDIYLDHSEGYCYCNLNEYRKVSIWEN